MHQGNPDLKWCYSCDQVKPVAEFSKHRGRSDGLQSLCKPCGRSRNRQWFADNAERRHAYDAARANSVAAYSQAWYRDNADRLNEHRREKYAANLEAERLRSRSYTIRKPGHSTVRSLRRRAILRGVLTIEFTDEQLAARLSMWAGKCWICGAPGTTLDHVKPLCAGGPHILANFRPACAICNKRKQGKWPITAEQLLRWRKAGAARS